jgi:FkbM family methyltransferase
MKYFLDFGTHHFEGLEEFINKLGIDKTFNVSCFEPNKDIYTLSRQNEERIKNYEDKFYSFNHFNSAVMNYTGEISFNSHKGAWTNNNKNEYINNYTCGSNCLDINPKCDVGNGVFFDIVTEKTACVDIADIMNSIVENDNDAEIYIKCDIEGSEFLVLPKLLDLHCVNKIKKMYIEWHERFWYGTDDYQNKISERANIINRFNMINIETFVHA